jgi:hypothetical protein
VAGDKRELTTPRFTIAVDERMRTDDVIPESEPEYTAITEMVAAGTAMIEELRKALVGLEGVEEILTQARAAAEEAVDAASRAADSEQGAARAAEEARRTAANVVNLAGAAADSAVQAEGSAQAANRAYVETEQIVAHAEDARAEAETAAREAREAAEEAKNAAGSGGGGAGYVASEEPPEDTKALWVDTTPPREAVALGVTGVETDDGADLYCTDELGTTKVSLRHGKDGNDSGQNATLYIGSDEPTGENRPLYWLDTSGDAPAVPDVPEEPEAVTLVGIAASYTGGDVAVGTVPDALTGVTVTASYSDGSAAAVTGYTLSGTIGEGSNTVTVTYQGKTATFTVAGVAQGGELPGIHEFVLNVPYLGSKASVLGEDVSGQNNPAIVAAGNPAANLPITDYLNSDYAELYAISYRPNAGDVYGGPMGWRAYRYGDLGDGAPVWQEETQIAEVSVSSTSGVDSSKLKIHKLVRADILAALNDGYSESDIRAIVQHIPNVGSKNYNVSVVWMATMPTEEQQQAIISYFENGGEA